MKKKQRSPQHGEPYWVAVMPPNFIEELADLLREAGDVLEVRGPDHLNRVYITLLLSEPVRVINRFGDHEPAPNRVTMARRDHSCHANQRFVCFIDHERDHLPKPGDMIVKLAIDMELILPNKEADATIDDMREEIRKLARAMTSAWYYQML